MNRRELSDAEAHDIAEYFLARVMVVQDREEMDHQFLVIHKGDVGSHSRANGALEFVRGQLLAPPTSNKEKT
jgi:hypothetical protein